MSRTRKGRRPRGNPLQKLLASKSAVIVKGAQRMGIAISSLATMEKLGWRRVN